jgi:hypothetical protein
MKTFHPRIAFLVLAGLSSASFGQNVPTLDPLTSFGSHFDGSIQPNDTTWVDTSFNQRGMAVDPVTGNLVYVDTHSGSGGSTNVQGAIYILQGTYGTNLLDSTGLNPFTLATNGINGGNYADAAAAVAADGVVYICNQVNSSTANPLTIYRWDSTASTNPPTVAFSGTITPAQRYGTSIDIRGGGPNTQIIIGSMPNSTSGTNVVIFTTANGTNFTAHVLATDVTTANFNDGISFGAGDTFWAKRIGSPLLLMSFNLGTASATTLKSYSNAIGSVNLGPIAVDTNNNLLAAIEETGGTVTGGAERVRLYSISDLTKDPQLLDVKDYAPNNQNGTAPLGYLDFAGTRLYSQVANNGLRAFNIGSSPISAPIVITAPLALNRVAAGQTFSFVVQAYPLVGYQWLSNGISISGATNGTLTLASVTTNYSATYTCVVSNSAGTSNLVSQLSVVNPADLYHLNFLWRVGADDGQPYMNFSGTANVPNQRSIAYYAPSNQLFVVSRSSVTTSNYDVYVVNATNGNVLHKLNTNGVNLYVPPLAGASGLALNAIAVSDDGSVYVCSETPDAAAATTHDNNSLLRIYRWPDGGSNSQASLVFQGEPTGQNATFRWGDNMTARGGGLSTRLLLDCNTRNPAATPPNYRYVAMLSPSDAFLTNFTSVWWNGTNSGTAIGKSLEFDGANNAIWQKVKAGALVRTTFDPSTIITPGTSPQIDQATAAVYPNFNGSVYGVGLDLSRNLAAGVFTNGAATAADQLNLYDISDGNSPLLLAQYSFPKVPRNQNGNFISQTFFSGNKLFSLDSQNGIMVFTVASGPLAPPTFVNQPQDLRLILGGTGTMNVATLETATFQWQKNGTNIPNATNAIYTISNAQLTDAAGYRVVANNPFSGNGTSTVATVTVSLPQDNYSLAPLWSIAPESVAFVTVDASSTPNQRSIAYNALSNEVYVVSRTGQSSGLTIHVLDAATGADLRQLDTTGISGGAIILVSIAVAADGAIYAGNLDSTTPNNTTNPPPAAVYKLYRWSNSASSTMPTLIFQGEPANQVVGLVGPVRWGDTLEVRGAGINTEAVIDSFQGAWSAVLKPSDASMGTFTNGYFGQSGPNNPIGRSLQFGLANTIWQKRAGDSLSLSTYNLATQSSSFITNYNNFPDSLGPVALDFTRNLMAGIDFSTGGSPDTVALYDISSLNSPLLVAKYNFPTNHQANANLIGQTVFAGDKVYSIDGNNGIVAFTIKAPQLAVNVSGGIVTLSWGTNVAGLVLQSTPSLSPASWADATNVVSVVGGRNTATDSSADVSKFYRLR